MSENVAATGLTPSLASRDRFWFERAGDDLPFYNGRPAAISLLGWLFVIAMTAVGFAALLMPVPALQKGIGGFVPAILFFAIPLAALAVVAPRHWTALFRRVGLRDIGWMVAFAILNIAVTIAIGLVFRELAPTTASPIGQILTTLSPGDRTIFFLRTLPQLFGEEVVSILPFLVVLTLLSAGAGAPRRWAIIGAWLAAALLFAAIHLPTYGWNFLQCFVVIGSARLILLLPYIMTRNIWVSAGAHIINDWTMFGALLLGGAVLTA